MRNRYVQGSLLLLLLWGGFALRVADLTQQSLWPDEVYSYVVSHWTLTEIVTGLRVDNVPLYTIGLGAWQILAGSGAFSLRYPSAVVSTLAIPLSFVLGRRLIGSSAGFAAALLLAVSPFQLYFAQEVRMYSLLGTLGLLVSWVFLKWAANPPRRVLALQSVLFGVLFYTHFAGFFVLVTHGTITGLSQLARRLDSRHRPTPRSFGSAVSSRWVLAWIGGVALFVPWVAAHFGPLFQIASGQTNHYGPPLGTIAAEALLNVSFGNNLGLDVGRPVDALVMQRLTWASLLLPLLGITAVLPRFRRRRITVHWRHVVAALHVVLPFALLIVLVQISRGFATRYAFPATSWVPILAVAGFWRFPPPVRWVGIAAALFFSLWGSLLYFQHPTFARLDFRSAVAYVADHRAPGDAVLISPDVTQTYDYYSGKFDLRLPREPMPARVPMDEEKTLRTLERVSAPSDRLWRIRWEDYYNDPNDVITQWLQRHAIHVVTRNLGGGLNVELWLTRKPTTSELPASATRFDGALGGTGRLVAYQVADEWPNRLTVTLYWILDHPLPDDYTVFLHLSDRNGHLVAQGDGPPYDGQYPTSQWPAGPIIRDVHEIKLDPTTAPGEYHLDLGFYVLKTMKRLGGPNDDSLHLTVPVGAGPRIGEPGPLLEALPRILRLDEALGDRQ